MSINIKEKVLLPHEWLAVITILAVFVSLTIMTQFMHPSERIEVSSHPHYVVDPEITVYVEGAVAQKGFFTVKRGTLIREVLEQAKPLPEADMRRVKLRSKARDSQVIKVPFEKKKKKA